VIRHFVARRAVLRMRPEVWDGLIADLGSRTEGRREAGAFLLASRRANPQTVVYIAYYDDLDPNSLSGGVTFGFEGFGPLWDLCDQKQLRVVGDVHTHPGMSVTQSSIDRSNPMVAKVGHVAVIVPHLAAQPIHAREAGVHRYLGDHGWDSHVGERAAKVLYIGRWA
jgi:hypothetical protein